MGLQFVVAQGAIMIVFYSVNHKTRISCYFAQNLEMAKGLKERRYCR